MPSSRYLFIESGFTLIELLVVLAVIILVATSILFSDSRFNSSILLRSAAYSVAASIREAQLYGVAVKAVSGSVNFTSAYGIDINKNISCGGMTIPVCYWLFADINKDGVYNALGDKITETFTLHNSIYIRDACAVPPIGASDCISNSGGSDYNLYLTFVRPNPNACILTSVKGPPNFTCANSPYSSATITIMYPNNTSAYTVTLWGTGAISIKKTS